MQRNINLSDVSFKEYNPFEEFEAVKENWLYMLKISANSFFLSWEWISCWLLTLPKSLDLRFYTGFMQGKQVIAFFIGSSRHFRKKIFYSRTLALNATGNSHYDRIAIEYNKALLHPDISAKIMDIFKHFPLKNWDEILFPGVSGNLHDEIKEFDEKKHLSYDMILNEENNSYIVDLDKIRKSNFDYFSLLSSNKRQQIRRSIKQYQKERDIIIKAASTLEEAEDMLSGLAELHESSWENRGRKGAFSNSYFSSFHKNLVKDCFHKGKVQLIHVHVNSTTIGYLYNFIHNKSVLFY